MTRSYKPEVQTVSDGDKWLGNALRFATREEAKANANDLMMRWFAVTAVRVVESEDEPNYRWVDGRLINITEEK